MDIRMALRRAFWRLTRRKGWLATKVDVVCADYRAAFSDMSYDIAENGELALLRAVASLRPQVIFDVGANQGDWSDRALSVAPWASVHAFELSPKTFAILSENLQGRGVALNAAGLSDRSGAVEFRNFGDGSPISTLVSTDFHTTSDYVLTTAQVLKGDDYCEERRVARIDLLKIDVEGAELRVLRGFERMLRERRIRCIQFEYGFANGDDHALMRDFHQFLGARGYVIGKLSSRGVAFGQFSYDQNQFTSGPNYVACQGDDRQCMDLLASFNHRP